MSTTPPEPRCTPSSSSLQRYGTSSAGSPKTSGTTLPEALSTSAVSGPRTARTSTIGNGPRLTDLPLIPAPQTTSPSWARRRIEPTARSLGERAIARPRPSRVRIRRTINGPSRSPKLLNPRLTGIHRDTGPRPSRPSRFGFQCTTSGTVAPLSLEHGREFAPQRVAVLGTCEHPHQHRAHGGADRAERHREQPERMLVGGPRRGLEQRDADDG